MNPIGVTEPAEDYLRIAVTADGAYRTRLRLIGELDRQTSPLLTAAVTRALERLEPETIELDLAELTLTDAGGIRCLLRCRLMACDAGTRLVLHNPTPTMVRVLDALGLDATLGLRVPPGARADPEA